MSKLVWHVTMSLDGFIAAPGDAVGWVFDYWNGTSVTAEEVIASTGALIIGRRTYEVEDRERGGIYGGAWRGPYFVLTHEPPAAIPGWMTGTFIDESIEEAVARAKQAASGRDVGILGATIARQCLEHGLVDEIVVHLAPLLLGDGVRLFDVPGGRRVELALLRTSRSGRLTDLRFRVSASELATS